MCLTCGLDRDGGTSRFLLQPLDDLKGRMRGRVRETGGRACAFEATSCSSLATSRAEWEGGGRAWGSEEVVGGLGAILASSSYREVMLGGGMDYRDSASPPWART